MVWTGWDPALWGAHPVSAPVPALQPLACVPMSSAKSSESPRAPAYRVKVESCTSCWPDSSRATAVSDRPDEVCYGLLAESDLTQHAGESAG